jgi:hypothetical protein
MNIALIVATIISILPGDNIDDALQKIALTKETTRINLSELNFMYNSRCQLKLYNMFMENPYKIPDYSGALVNELLLWRYSMSDMLISSSQIVDVGISNSLLIGQIIEFKNHFQEKDCLYSSVIDLYDYYGEKPNKKLLKTKVDLVPQELAIYLSSFLYCLKQSLKWRALAFKDLSDEEIMKAYSQATIYIANDSAPLFDEMMREVEYPISKINYGYLYFGALYTAYGLDSLCIGLRRMDKIGDLSITIPTPIGDILINGSRDDIYPSDKTPFLVIDFGGNDKYYFNSSAKGKIQPISIIIDLQGDDIYQNENDQLPSFGGAIFSYSFLFDYNGNDLYKGKNVTQGAGFYGVGVLYDGGGNDSLFSRALSQGAGDFGIGILINIGGSDYYSSYQQSQGYGYIKGCGILIDDDGDDRYLVNDSDIVYPSAQSSKHNSSYSQGMGRGKRADFLDGNSLAGGVGILIDKTGNDTYQCGVFGQGCGFWFGTGILSDISGEDNYSGACYVQGCGVHNAVSVLLDNAGNDTYQALLRMAQGVGKDLSISYFIDGGGNDHYIAPSTSLGVGQANGIGIFWDKAGDDIYEVKDDYALGFSEILSKRYLRQNMFSLGLFLDGAGEDIYSKSFTKNKSFWIQPRVDSIPVFSTEKYIGVDY